MLTILVASIAVFLFAKFASLRAKAIVIGGIIVISILVFFAAIAFVILMSISSTH